MKCFSFFKIIFGCFLLYTFWQILSILQLAATRSLKCTEEPCLESYLNSKPKLRMALLTTISPYARIVNHLDNIRDFYYHKEFQRDYNITLSNDRSLWMIVIVGADDGSDEWKPFNIDETSQKLFLPLGKHAIPGIDVCEPDIEMNDKIPEEPHNKESEELKPVFHLYKNVYVNMLTEEFSVNKKDIPFEFKTRFKINNDNKILPILENDFFRTRHSDLVEMNVNKTIFQVTFNYNPIDFHSHQIMILIYDNLKIMGQLDGNLDGLKEYLSQTSFNMLILLMVFNILKQFLMILSFKNDISFWRSIKTYAGLSMSTTLLRLFGTAVIFLYLRDEDAPLIILIPAGIAVIIELWKCKKMFKIEFTIRGIKRRLDNESYDIAKAEKETHDLDKEAMLYLSYILCPLFLGGTIYFLVYPPFRTWYSWTVVSLAKGIYTFGILFMFPQFYINYKLKSVAAVPWRPFTYKAFNTFIIDVQPYFTSTPDIFKITCFRDDITFIIFLYQRWIYPIKNNLRKTNLAIDGEETEEDINNQQEEEHELHVKKEN